MTAQIIPFPDAAAWTMRVRLDGIACRLSGRWNSRAELWSLDIATEDGTPIVQAIHIVPDYPLLMIHADKRLPPGELIALDQTGGRVEHIGRKDFAEGRVVLMYVP